MCMVTSITNRKVQIMKLGSINLHIFKHPSSPRDELPVKNHGKPKHKKNLNR